MLDVVFVTHRGGPALDSDETRLGDACARLGLRWDAVPWDADFDWSRTRMAVVRSTWDYSRRRDAFVAWARRAAGLTLLHNPAPVLERNTEKSYLLDLAARGVPVIETALVEPGQVRDLDAFLRERGWDDAVVKPAVSAGSWRTYRVRRGDRSHDMTRARRLLLVKRCLVQPFLASVIDPGERALVFLDGELSHAIRKRSAFEPPDVPYRVQVEPREDERALAREALRAEGGDRLLYARVDVVRTARGPVLMELELTEPRLFLSAVDPSASQRFAEAIAARLTA